MKILLSLAMAVCVASGQRLVTLNLSARDAQGHAVTDLTAADLEVTDQGKTAPILSFRNEALRSPAVAREYSNRPAPALSQIQVILFDMLNLSQSSRQTTIDQTVKALESLPAADSVYFYLLNLYGELVPVRALPDAAPSPTPAATPWTKDIRALLDKAAGPVAVVHTPIERDVMLRVQRSYAALETLAVRMMPLPGRKNILWTTIGVPCSIPTENGQIWDCRETLGKIATRLNQADVAVNPVALQAGTADVESAITLQQFADITGGKTYSADIEHAVADCIDGARSSYRLKYAPAANNWDGKQHKVHVTSSRKGVTILAPQSYTADKAAPAANTKERNAALFAAPFDVSDIGLSVAAGPGAQPHSLHMRIGMDIQDLLLAPQADKFALQLTFTVAAFLADNKVQNYDPLPVNAMLTPEQRTKMSRDGLHLGHDVTLPEGARKVRLLVEDRAGNSVGTVTIPLGQ
ncbi:MAG TPA: VWA domain-containing protein [Candidatus Sulfopaludibacter sp.]|nr:VWA domain-containing protein [Candidatus Sulfopaludibacter sp.]